MSNENNKFLVTGKSDNLTMHALRNEKGEMVGWIFIDASVDIQKMEADIKWNFKVDVNPTSPNPETK